MSDKPWSERVVVVTGATQGIGFVTARELARLGARTVLVARDEARGHAAVAAIKRETGNAAVELALADFSSQEQIRALAIDLHKRLPKIDVLINNAGAIYTEREVTVDGIEKTFAVNHLGYFLLTNLVLDLVRKAGRGARIVSVSSDLHRSGKIDFDDLNATRKYSGMRAYSASKLANVLFTRELARQLEGTGITANCLHPGVVATGFGKNNTGFFKQILTLASPFFLSPDAGAKTTLYLATSSDVATTTGRYFAKCREKKASLAAQSDKDARRLWDVSLEMVHLT